MTRRCSQERLIHGLLAAATTAAPAVAQWTPPYWRIERLGLTDPEHTAADGHRGGYSSRVNAEGSVVGYSSRYNGGERHLGSSAWVWRRDRGTTRLGFFDEDHTTSDGHRNTWLTSIDDSGRVAGFSSKYAGSGPLGDSAWVWSPTTGQVRLAYPSVAPPRSNESEFSYVEVSGDALGAVGSTSRYLESAYLGTVAWVWYRASGYTRLGYVDSAHTRTDGIQRSLCTMINDREQVIGWSSRFNGPLEPSETAWIWEADVGLTRVGLIDAEHTRSSGEQESRAEFLNASGRVSGYSDRFAGPWEFGRSAWTWTREAGTTRIGLLDAEHTRLDGFQLSQPEGMNELGHVVGSSRRYAGLIESGRSVWVWTPTMGTREIGLTDAAHTRPDGSRVNWIKGVSESGAVFGHANGLDYLPDPRLSAWAWTESTGTVRLGLFDEAHTREDGKQVSGVHEFNQNGLAIGASERFRGPGTPRYTYWMYDASTNTQTVLEFAESPVVELRIAPRAVTDDGVLVGSFARFEGTTLLESGAFIWSPSKRLGDLRTFVRVGIAVYGWDRLYHGTHVSADAMTIVGEGRTLAGETSADFVMTLIPPCAGDADGDGAVTFSDVTFVLQHWGSAYPTTGPGDADGDGEVAFGDITIVLQNWAAECDE